MKRRSEPASVAPSLRDKIIGLGERSLRKSYYPQLRQQLEEAEKARRDLEEKSVALLDMLRNLERTRTELADSQARYRSLAENINDVIFSLSTDGTVTYISPVSKTLCGLEPEQIIGQPFDKFVHPDDLPGLKDGFSDVLAGRLAPREFRLRNTKGVFHHVRSSSRPSVEEGRVVGLTGIISDIDDRKRAEEELRRLNQTLERRVLEELARNREKDLLLIQQSRLAAMGEMVHNIAHQWRQPLNALGIILANIQDDYEFGELTKESLNEFTAKGRQIVQRMSNTIDDFRDFFRPDKEKGNFSVAQCLRELETILGAALSDLNIELAGDIGEGTLASGYDNDFSQVLLNVVNNSKEAIVARRPAQGRISVKAETRGDMVEVRVADNGGGIPEHILPKIFDPYFTTKDKGTGIGLYMSKMIVEGNMGGEISARNIDDGAEIVIRLPAGHA